MQIRHEQSRPHTFARNVRYDKPEPSVAEIKKVVIVPADGPSGTANPRVDKRLNQRLALRKQTALHLLGDCQVVRGLALRLQPGGLGAALCFQRARRLINL